MTIGDNITKIGNYPFENCTLLTDIYVNINDLATYCCKINNSSSIPGNKHLLVNGSEITELVIPDSVTEIGGSAFNGCTSLTSVTIPDGVTEIGGSAFSGCTSLTSVTIPDGVTEIGRSAFSGCTSLTSVTIPDSVTKIGENVFYYCTSLTSITIPDSVTYIGGAAFNRCTSLKEVYCKATTPPTGGYNYIFDNNASGRKIYVPRESVSAYKSAEVWKDYAYYIVGYDFE